MNHLRLRAFVAALMVTTVALGLSSTSAAPAQAADIPRITNVSPSFGSADGGDLVTLTGTGFTGAVEVEEHLGASVYTYSDFTILSDTTIQLVTQPGRGVAYFSVTRAGSGTYSEPFWFRPILSDAPVRVLPRTQLAPDQPLCVRWEDWPGIPQAHGQVQTAVLNVTTVQPQAPGHVIVYPYDSILGIPTASTVNYLPGADVANVTVVPLYPGVPICAVARAAAVGLILDVVAVHSSGELSAHRPERRLDTRPGGFGDVHGALPANVRVPANIPYGGPGMSAYLANVTVPSAPAPGNLRIFPRGAPLPTASTANYLPGNDRATAAVVMVDESRADLFSASTSSRGTDVIVDVYGGIALHPTIFVPAVTRVVDTRTGLGAPRAALPATKGGSYVRLAVSSLDRPATAYGAILSVIVSNPTAPGHLRVHSERTPGGSPPPDTSNVNYVPGVDSSNLVWVDLWKGGDVAFSSWQATGNVNVVVDVVGYFTTPD